MIRPLTFALVGLAIVVLPNALFGQARRYPLRAVRIAVAPDVALRPEYLAGTIEPEACSSTYWIGRTAWSRAIVRRTVAQGEHVAQRRAGGANAV